MFKTVLWELASGNWELRVKAGGLHLAGFMDFAAWGARGLQVSSQEAGERVASFQKGRFKAEAETFTLRRVHEEMTDHYQTLGLHRRCTEAQIRTAYRMLAKQHHPDVNGGSEESVLRTRMLNAAHEVLSDPEARAAYDRELAAAERASVRVRAGRIEKNVAQDITLRLEDFLKGTRLEIRVNDPANPDGPETYTCEVPAGTAPGARFRVPREGAFRGGHVLVRVKAGADFQFKARGSDLRCDLRISADRAAKGGSELLRGVGGGSVRVEVPKGVGRGEIVRVTGEGLPRPRGGRGDLLVRIQYRPEVTVRRAGK